MGHKLNKPTTNHMFRGFLEVNGVVSALFLLENEPDPEPPVKDIVHHHENVSNVLDDDKELATVDEMDDEDVNVDVLVCEEDDITPSQEPKSIGPWIPSQFLKSQSPPELEGYYKEHDRKSEV